MKKTKMQNEKTLKCKTKSIQFQKSNTKNSNLNSKKCRPQTNPATKKQKCPAKKTMEKYT